MTKKLIVPALLCAALLWHLAPAAQAASKTMELTSKVGDVTPAGKTPSAADIDAATLPIVETPEVKTAPADTKAPSTSLVVETPEMKAAVKAYDTGSYEEAFIITEPLAKLNHADAQYLLGLMYEFGHGVTKDVKKAAELFTDSASQGYAAAQAKLGHMHLAGDANKDYGKAASWFKKAADQGYAVAYSALGDLYYNGYGVSENKDTALEYYKKAATAGDAESCLRLGECYERGIDVKKDHAQALFWYKKGADLGNAACAAKVKQMH